VFASSFLSVFLVLFCCDVLFTVFVSTGLEFCLRSLVSGMYVCVSFIFRSGVLYSTYFVMLVLCLFGVFALLMCTVLSAVCLGVRCAQFGPRYVCSILRIVAMYVFVGSCVVGVAVFVVVSCGELLSLY